MMRNDPSLKKLEVLSEQAQMALHRECNAVGDRAKASARQMRIGIALVVAALTGEADPTELAKAGEAVEKVLDDMGAAFSAGKWAGAPNLLGDLIAGLKDFCQSAGIAYDAGSGDPSPAELVAGLSTAIENKDQGAAIDAIAAIRTAVDTSEGAPAPTTTARATTGQESSTSMFVDERRRRAEIRRRVDLATSLSRDRPAAATPAVGQRGTTDRGGGTAVMVGKERVELTASEVIACRDVGAKLEDYARNKLLRGSRRG